MANDVKIKISAQNDTDKGFNEAERNFKSLQKEAEKMGAAIGVAFVAAAAASVYLVKASIDAMDEMSKLAQQTGTTVESLSALSFAADLSGVSNEDLGSALVKLTRNMSDAANGTGIAVEGFKALGISVTNADGSLKGSDAVLTEIAQKFASFKDGAEKTALAVNVFGKSGAQLIPLLNSGADGLQAMKEEAAQLGIILDTTTSKAAEQFNDNLTRIGAAIKGLANTAAKDLLPTLNDLSDQFVELAKSQAFVETTTAIVKASIGGLINIFQVITVLASDVAFVLNSVGKSIGGVAAGYAALARLDIKGFNAISNAIKEDSDLARIELDKFQARILAIGSTAAPKFKDTRLLGDPGSIAAQVAAMKQNAPGIAAPGAGKGAKGPDPDADFKRFMENLQKQIERTQDLTATEQLLADIQNGLLTVTPAQEAKLKALTTELDLIKTTATAKELRRQISLGVSTAEGDANNKSNEGLRDRLKLLTDPTPSAVLEKQRSDMIFLTQEYQRFIDTAGAAGISQKTYLEAVGARLDLNNEKTKDAKTLAEELGLTFTSAFEDAIVNGKGLRDVLDGIGKDIARIIVRKQITEPFANAIGNVGSSFGDKAGSFFSDIFSGFKFAGGGTTGNGPRTGGLDGQGGFMAMLHPQETVIDHARGQSVGGGGVTIVQNINIDSRSDQASIMAAMRQAANLAKQEIMRSRQSGGAFA
jgi:hypothetical protein